MNEIIEKLEMKIDQVAGALQVAEDTPTLGQDTGILEAQADLYRALIDMVKAIDTLTNKI